MPDMSIKGNDARITVIGKSWPDGNTDSGDGDWLEDLGDLDPLDDGWEDLIVDPDTLPDAIEIITPPAKTTYKEGERISLSGMTVIAKKDGATWTSDQYPNGVVPHRELIISPNVAVLSGKQIATEMMPYGLPVTLSNYPLKFTVERKVRDASYEEYTAKYEVEIQGPVIASVFSYPEGDGYGIFVFGDGSWPGTIKIEATRISDGYKVQPMEFNLPNLFSWQSGLQSQLWHSGPGYYCSLRVDPMEFARLYPRAPYVYQEALLDDSFTFYFPYWTEHNLPTSQGHRPDHDFPMADRNYVVSALNNGAFFGEGKPKESITTINTLWHRPADGQILSTAFDVDVSEESPSGHTHHSGTF